MEQNNCDGSGPRAHGAVKILPYPGGNLILCARCFAREITWRRERNRSLSAEAKFALPTWDSCFVYGDAP